MSEEQKPSFDFTSDTVPEQSTGYELQKTACCYFLKGQESKNLVKLNDSSALIWQVCTGEWSVGEIIDVLKESYPDAAESMDTDVMQALNLLYGEGVIQVKAEV